MSLLCTASASADRELGAKLASELSRFERSFPKAQVGFSLKTVDRNSRSVFEHKEDALLKPASVVKLLTSVAALKGIGGEYRFPTEVFLLKQRSGADRRIDPADVASASAASNSKPLPSIFVRGYGDPSLVDEDLFIIARRIRESGITELDTLSIDASLFIDPYQATGDRAYQAAQSATSLNHNSYRVSVYPGPPGAAAYASLTRGAPLALTQSVSTKSRRSGRSLRISQNPASSGFVPAQFFRKSSAGLQYASGAQASAGVQGGAVQARVSLSGWIGANAKPRDIYRSVPHPPSYFGAVLAYLLKEQGVTIRRGVFGAEVPAEARLIYTHESPPLSDILRDLNRYSNNFIAGQLLFALGQNDAGSFSAQRGLQRVAEELEAFGLPRSEYVMRDASGLSADNRLSAEQLTRVLVAGYRNFAISPDLIASLSRYGHSGTLKKRSVVSEKALAGTLRSERPKLAARGESVWGKTGTLTGVSSLAGYLHAESDELMAYAMLVNGVPKAEGAALEDRLLKIVIGARD